MSYEITVLESQFGIEPPLNSHQQNELKSQEWGWQASPNGMYLYFPGDADVHDVLGNLEEACSLISGFGCAVNGSARWVAEDGQEGTVEVTGGEVTIIEDQPEPLSQAEEERLLLLIETGKPDEQWEAIDILVFYETEPDKFLPRLAIAFQSPSLEVRLKAAETMTDLGPAAAPNLLPLIQGLTDPEPWVRAAAAEALGAIGPAAQAAVPALLELRKDPNYGPSGRAKEALEKIQSGNSSSGV